MAQSTYSLSLTGGGDAISVETGGATGSTLSLSLWVRPVDATALNIYFEGRGGSGDWYFGQAGGHLRFTTLGVADYNFTTLLPTSGVWQHVGFTLSGSTCIAYLNGVSETQSVTPPNGAAHGLSIGDALFGGFAIHGGVDDVAVLLSLLTGTQMADIAGNPAVGGSSSLDVGTLTTYLLWRAEAGSGSTLADTSGNGFTGTFAGGVGWSALNDVPLPLQAGGGGAGLFMATPLTGLGTGGHFFSNPLG